MQIISEVLPLPGKRVTLWKIRLKKRIPTPSSTSVVPRSTPVPHFAGGIITYAGSALSIKLLPRREAFNDSPMDVPSESNPHLTWENVGLGFLFIVFDAAVSTSLGLGVGRSLVTAALRCVVQLSLMALVLQKIFEAKNPWGVAGLACKFFL
jgi:hypothetical protein